MVAARPKIAISRRLVAQTIFRFDLEIICGTTPYIAAQP
jgi:hypothetical protein